jgi:hypothetical protein
MSIAQPGGIAPTATSRHAVALLATGGFLLLAGALFAAPFLLNTRTQENDVFLTNLFSAPLFSLLGTLLYLLALRRFGFSTALTILALVVSLIALTGWLWLPLFTTPSISLLALTLLADAALLFIVGALVAGTHRQWDAWTRGMALALVAGTALAVIYSYFGGQYLAIGETTSSLPPYLNEVTLIASVALAALVYWLGWLWGRSH